MRYSGFKLAMLALFLTAGTMLSHAQTIVTVGPSGQYPTPCAAFPNLTDGETVQVDANGGVPYAGQADCLITANNLTIVGVNGRTIIDGSGTYTNKGLWVVNGHDIVIDNFEFRNASGSQNAEAFRIQNSDGSSTPDGGNVTLQHSYVHDNGTGVLSENAEGPGSGLEWYSSSPYITFQYDEFVHNGNHDGQGNTHNIYMGFDLSDAMTFTIQYSWSHDSYVGHTLKDREPNSNVLYNLFSDEEGNSSYLNQFPLGGSVYVVGNIYDKAVPTNVNTGDGVNLAMFLFADASDNTSADPEYAPPHQDLHFVNNTMVDNSANSDGASFVNISCVNTDNSQCSQPGYGPPVSIAAVVENNIFVGNDTEATNQTAPAAYVRNNILEANTPSNLSALFVDAAHFDFHLAAGSPAIQAGIYPPTDNTGAADPNALAKYEFQIPTGAVSRPTPSGSTMDAGAYSYPRVDTPPTLNLSYTNNVTAPATGTITVSGLPNPPAGQYNYASFISSNQAAVPNPPAADSTTGTVTTTFTVNPAVTAPTPVTIDVYAGGAHAVATVTVNPGPPVLSSITQDYNYDPATSVHLEGPAPAGGTVIDLSSSDPTYLYVPSSVTVPEGQISAETGSNTGSLWGQSPSVATETITATQGSVQKTVTLGVFTPGFHSTETEYNSVVGGGPLAWCVVMVGFFPNSTGSIQVTSSNTAVIPNQTITSGYNGCNGTLAGSPVSLAGTNFDGDIAIATNPVSINTTVNVTLTLNGDSTNGEGVPNTTAITVTSGTPVPSAPSGLSATAASSSSVNLSWTASTTSGVSYSVYRDVTNGFTPGSGNQIASGLSGTTYSDTGLTASTTYYYVVEAVNGSGNSGASNQASATTSASSGDVIAINAGGSATGSYSADEDYSGSSGSYSNSNTIDTSGVTNPAPQAVYQSERYATGAPFTYTLPDLTPGGNYTVRLHFAEIYYTSTGQREFNVLINGTQVLTNFDIVAAAGGPNKAVAETFQATANSSGQIVVEFTYGAADGPKVSGIEVQPATSGGTSDVAAIDAGGAGSGSYAADEDYSGGNTASTGPSQAINTANVVNPAPQEVYQTERWGASTYTIPGLTSGAAYTVRLHFSENTYSSANQRQFNVSINGTQVLTNFDVYAAAGGEFTAVAEDFTAVANSSGQIVIAFTNGTSSVPDTNPSIKAIEIQTAGDAVALNAGGSAVGSYAADADYSGSSGNYSNSNSINTSNVVNPAPAAVYQSERYAAGAPFTYTIPGLTAGATYTVRLHFAEIYYTSPGQREFNVSINGTQVLTNFDIVAAAGGANTAVAKDFTAVANSSGQIVIEFTYGAADGPKISGIEVRH